MASAWTDPAWREAAVYAVARYVSKLGSCCGTLAAVAEAGLSVPELVEFYAAVRSRAGRLELEWRPEFEAAFPAAAPHLPPVSREEFANYWEQVLYDGITLRDADQVRRALEACRERGVPLASLSRFAPESLELGGPIWWGEGNEPDEGLTLSQIAERVGGPEVQALIREAAEAEPGAAPDPAM